MIDTKLIVPPDYSNIWILGIRFNPDSDIPEFYTLMFSAYDHVPLMCEDKYILAFSNIDSLKAFCKKEFPDLETDSLNVELICEIASILYLISSEQEDSEVDIIDGLNIIFDLINATDQKIKEPDKRLLFAFADHMTFTKDIAAFFEEKDFTREDLIDSIIWCVGLIVTSMKFMHN
ncbi:hypothetical protein TUMEXPCC7403_25030 [Tumidithrix helvetica PCC 7403]|uniref:hypothetical protein n=1 Tax=Tumidithrix helvetica TaxID=3457545 RepID=UPI003CBC3D48